MALAGSVPGSGGENNRSKNRCTPFVLTYKSMVWASNSNSLSNLLSNRGLEIEFRRIFADLMIKIHFNGYTLALRATSDQDHL